MKLRNKITLLFCLLTSSLFLLTFLFIYFTASRFTDRHFFQRLEERAEIAAQTVIVRDETDAAIYSEIRRRHLEVLEEETERVYRLDTLDRQSSMFQDLPASFIDNALEKGQATTKVNGHYYLGMRYDGSEGSFLVLISAMNSFGEEELSNLLNNLMIASILGLISLYFIGRYYAGRILQPLNRMDRDMKEIRATNLHLRLPTNGTPDELNRLAGTFNDMLDRLEQAFQVQTTFVNNASHELRNPLTAILGETEVALLKDRSPEEYKRVLCTIETEANRLHLLVQSLLNMAQTGTQKQELLVQPIRMEELIQQVMGDLNIRKPDNQINLTLVENKVEDCLWIRGNSALLRSALANLLENACKFSGNAPVELTVGPSARGVKVIIEDHGVGIPADDLGHISEPFYRAPNARTFSGSGIGLPLARKVFQMHGAELNIHSAEDKGTRVEVLFPFAPLDMAMPGIF